MAVIKLFHALISCQSYKSRAQLTLLNLLIFHSLLPIQRFMTSCLTRNQTTFKLIYLIFCDLYQELFALALTHPTNVQ